MASAPDSNNPPSNLAPPSSNSGTRSTDRIVIYRHSNLFYWWPIWLLGFVFAGITYFDNWHLAIVPAGTEAVANRKVEIDNKGTLEERNVLILAKGKDLWKHKDDEGEVEINQPKIYIARYKTLGSIYAMCLLLVVSITNVSIRGLWTVFVFVLIIMLAFILGAAGWWEFIFHKFGQLSIHINMGGYLLISTVLFILWLITLVFFDRQKYMIFTPGQMRVRLEVGGEETVYDTTGMAVQRQRADLFRHWVLGFGSGDLTVKPVGLANPLEFPNVMFVGSKVAKIERMVKEKVIVRSEQKPANP